MEAESKKQKESESQREKQGFRVMVRHIKRLGEGRFHGLGGMEHIHNRCALLRANPSSKGC